MAKEPTLLVSLMALAAIAMTLTGVWMLWRGGETRRGLLLVMLSSAMMVYVAYQQSMVVNAG